MDLEPLRYGTSLAGSIAVRRPSIAPAVPRHPERICWGCDLRCPADDLKCGEDTPRSKHPSEVFGADWVEWVAGRKHS